MRLESPMCYISYCQAPIIIAFKLKRAYLDLIAHVIWKNKNPRGLAGMQDKLAAKKWPTSGGRWLP